MAILVTGGAGFIGSHTCAELLASGEKVVVADDFSAGSPAALDAVARLAGQEPVSYRADLRDRGAIDSIFARHPIDAVIHFAARKAVGESVRDPLGYFDVNIGGTLALLQVMAARRVTRLVFSSSCSVYGDRYAGPIAEDDPPAPANPYARSKLACEQILADVCRRYPDFRVIVLRYFNPVGAHPSGMVGEVPSGEPENLMPYLVQVAAGRRPELAIFGNDYPTADGTAVRDYLHVVDVALAHVLALAYLDDEAGMSVLNLGTGTGVSVLQLVTAFQEACGVTVKYRFAARRPGDVASLIADAGRVRRQWGWQPARDVGQMCRDAWRFQQRYPNGYQ